MKNGIFRAVLAAAALGLFAASLVYAEDAPAEPEKVTITGMVSVTRNDDGGITAVMVTTKEASYMVTLDEKGMKLGEEMEGKEVEVVGVVIEEDEVKWITVESYKEVEKPAEPA
jgi:hypothetical protein